MTALLAITAAAMAGVTSPSRPLAMAIPMGPIKMSIFPAFKISAFSPVAPSWAPAYIMAAVAIAFVPNAGILPLDLLHQGPAHAAALAVNDRDAGPFVCHDSTAP